ncbi:MAG: metallophosphoesterase [Spirochaetales bacterium]|nr:metallophosphoesterase [Spirochaetales bacterium]
MIKQKIARLIISLVLVLGSFVLGSCVSITNKTITGEQSGEIWSEDSIYDRESVPALVKKQNEDFKILLFSDIQLDSFLNDAIALELVDTLVKEVRPDMIMTAGDNTAWIFADDLTLKLISQMESYNIPWGVTLGNHDSEGSADRIWHGNQYENAANSLFSSGPSNIQGIGNYSVNIEDEDGNIIYTLIMMDSNVKRAYEDENDYDYIYDNQIEWYEWLIKGITSSENKVLPSMLFFHIPLPEFKDTADAWKNNEIGEAYAFGEIRERVCCPPVNTGLFDSAMNLGSTTHIFCGHDHVNNLSVDWKGIRLTYGLKTGPASYSNSDMQGATLITIMADGNEVKVEHIFK